MVVLFGAYEGKTGAPKAAHRIHEIFRSKMAVAAPKLAQHSAYVTVGFPRGPGPIFPNRGFMHGCKLF